MKNKRLLWAIPIEKALLTEFPPLLSEHSVFILRNKKIYAFDKETGILKWVTAINRGSRINRIFIKINNNIIVDYAYRKNGKRCRGLYSYDIEGNLLWDIPLDAPLLKTSYFHRDSHLFITIWDKENYSVFFRKIDIQLGILQPICQLPYGSPHISVINKDVLSYRFSVLAASIPGLYKLNLSNNKVEVLETSSVWEVKVINEKNLVWVTGNKKELILKCCLKDNFKEVWNTEVSFARFAYDSNRICFIYNLKYLRIVDAQQGEIIHDIEIPINDNPNIYVSMRLQGDLLYLNVDGSDHFLIDIDRGQVLQKNILNSKSNLNTFTKEDELIFMAGYSQLQAFSIS